MVYRHRMKNGKYKNFRSKSAFEAWKRGMFGNMQHDGKVRFVSREAQAKAKINYKQKAFSREKDVTGKSDVVSGRVKAHGSSVKVEKLAGKDKATGYRTQSTSTDNFIVAETEEAGKYTPLNTELSIEELDDDITITRTSKTDGRVISTTIIKAAEPESIHNFFLDLEDRFSDDEELKLWELRALADHFNVRSGGLTVSQLEGRLKGHTEGNLEQKYYRNPKTSSEEGMSEEERRDQAEAIGDVPEVDSSTGVTETPFSFERSEQQRKAALQSLQPRTPPRGDLSPLELAATEEAIIATTLRDDESIIEGTMEDKTTNSPEESEHPDGLIGEALDTDKPLIQPRKTRSKSKLSRSMSFTKYPDSPNDKRKPISEIFASNQNRTKLIDDDANTFSFYKDDFGEVKLTGVVSDDNDNLAKKFNKQQVMERFNISGDFDIDYTIDDR